MNIPLENLEILQKNVNELKKENHKAYVSFGKSYIEDKFICWYNDYKNAMTKYKINMKQSSNRDKLAYSSNLDCTNTPLDKDNPEAPMERL